MSSKFDWDKPLYCNPYIAVAISAEAGIVYERLRWMIQDTKGKKREFGSIRDDGQRWVDFTYAELLPYIPIFKSAKALRDVIAKLEKANLIVSEPIKGGTKWYTISDLDPSTLTKNVSLECDENRQGVIPNSSGGMTKIVRGYDENRQGTHIYSNRINSEAISSQPDSSSSTTSDFQSSEEEEISTPVPTPEINRFASKPKTHDLAIYDPLMKALAEKCGLIYPTTIPKIAKELGEGVALIRQADPTAKASDLRYYCEYYATVRDSDPRWNLPTVSFIASKWLSFKAWLEPMLSEEISDYLPGTDHQLTKTRREWVAIDEMPAGGVVTGEISRGLPFPDDWQKWPEHKAENWYEAEFTKQPDGTFLAEAS